VLVSGSDDVDGLVAGLTVAGSSDCAVKITLEAGYSTARISCSMLEWARGCCGAAAPPPAGACADAKADTTNTRDPMTSRFCRDIM
jgi:hypothetical protein